MLSVGNVLGHRPLHLDPLVRADLARPVRWVAASELTDPAPFLEGGEILLTTGLSTTDWQAEWEPYVARLVQAGVVALGLAVGLTHARAPAPLQAACERHGLTLFAVPRATTFVSISRFVAHKIEEAEQAAATEALALQRRLTEAALQPGDTQALLGVLATALGGSAAVLGRDGGLEAGPLGPASSSMRLDAVRGEVARIRPLGLRASASSTARGGTTVVQPFGLQAARGYLAVWSPRQLDERRRGAVMTVVALLSLAAERRDEQRYADRRLIRRALELLVTGDTHTAELLLEVTDAGGRTPRWPDPLRVVRASGPDDALEEASASLDPAGTTARETGYTLGLPTRVAEQVVAARVEEELWLVVPADTWEKVAQLLTGRGLTVGVGGVTAAAGAARSHTAAGHALAQTTPGNPVVVWERLIDQGFLALVEEADRVAFARELLAGLDAGRTPRRELEATLAAFLRLHGRIGPVAEELGVHRNTVRHRVAEVERLIGRSLDDPQTRVDTWIALQVLATGRFEAPTDAR